MATINSIIEVREQIPVVDWQIYTDSGKAALAFQIIWSIVALIELIYILRGLLVLLPTGSRVPFTLLAFVTLCAAILYPMAAISSRVGGQVRSILTVLDAVQIAFLPAVILCLIHLRGRILRAVKGDTTSSLASQPWKRVLDWILAVAAFVSFMAHEEAFISLEVESIYPISTNVQRTQLLDSVRQLGHIFAISLMLLYADVIVSLIVHFFQGRRAQASDPIISRLLFIAAPFIACHALETLIFADKLGELAIVPIYDDTMALFPIRVATIGTCRVVIIATVIITMKLPNVRWTVEIPTNARGTILVEINNNRQVQLATTRG